MKVFACVVLAITLIAILICQHHCLNRDVESASRIIVDVATWRNIKHIRVIAHSEKRGSIHLLQHTLSLFQERGLFVSFLRMDDYNIEPLPTYRQMIVAFIDNATSFPPDTVEEKTINAFGVESIAWLLILSHPVALSDNLYEIFYKEFKLPEVVLNSDLTIALMLPTACENHESTLDNAGETVTPRRGVSLYSKNLDKKTISDFCGDSSGEEPSVCLLQVFQTKRSMNSTIAIHEIGTWKQLNGTTFSNTFLIVERRLNFHMAPLVFGLKNLTLHLDSDDDVISEEPALAAVDDYDIGDDLAEVIDYLLMFFNATQRLTMFNRIGIKNGEGYWTGLLGAVVSEQVDIALDFITTTPERYNDMSFTHTFMESMRNIYIRPQESNAVRDIFLVPFGARLLLCVLGTAGLLGISMYIIRKSVSDPEIVIDHRFAFSDSVIWCIGVFSMQGSLWNPNSYSGKVMVFTSLTFAILVYNSYSAFITSVLSVESSDIRSITDLLSSDYELGYAKNSQDELFLRTANDTQMKQIYLRGYLDSSVNNITDGLLKTTEGSYGFFATSYAARKALRSLNNCRCRYNIKEIQIKSTKSSVAFPMASSSPYRKVINLSIMRMIETGIHKHIHSNIIPGLNQCSRRRTYRTASLPDLTTAFAILLCGIMSGTFVLIMENFWIRKTKLYQSVKRELDKHRIVVNSQQDSNHQMSHTVHCT